MFIVFVRDDKTMIMVMMTTMQKTIINMMVVKIENDYIMIDKETN